MMTPSLPAVSELNQLELKQFGNSIGVLFEPCDFLTQSLYSQRPYNSYSELIRTADNVMIGASHEHQVEMLAAHPKIGQRKNLSALSSAEQGLGDATSETVLNRLDSLNQEYEHKFGFCFVEFVNGRPKAEIIPVIERRLGNSSEDETKIGLEAMCLIASDRLKKLGMA
eukprot:CFRG0037T1